jgi:hypothetical protein
VSIEQVGRGTNKLNKVYRSLEPGMGLEIKVKIEADGWKMRI